ncbi:MAG: preprotein translocase subunit SecE [Rubrobacter sp.]|nr:preprotein translocase subunit SecE [Rubrobacter sp.]
MGKKRSRDQGGKKPQQQKKQQGRLAGIRDFFRGVRNELRRVSWPGRDQLRQSTAVVLIIVVVLGAYVAAWDFVFQNVARLIFS